MKLGYVLIKGEKRSVKVMEWETGKTKLQTSDFSLDVSCTGSDSLRVPMLLATSTSDYKIIK